MGLSWRLRWAHGRCSCYSRSGRTCVFGISTSLRGLAFRTGLKDSSGLIGWFLRLEWRLHKVSFFLCFLQWFRLCLCCVQEMVLQCSLRPSMRDSKVWTILGGGAQSHHAAPEHEMNNTITEERTAQTWEQAAKNELKVFRIHGVETNTKRWSYQESKTSECLQISGLWQIEEVDRRRGKGFARAGMECNPISQDIVKHIWEKGTKKKIWEAAHLEHTQGSRTLQLFHHGGCWTCTAHLAVFQYDFAQIQIRARWEDHSWLLGGWRRLHGEKQEFCCWIVCADPSGTPCETLGNEQGKQMFSRAMRDGFLEFTRKLKKRHSSLDTFWDGGLNSISGSALRALCAGKASNEGLIPSPLVTRSLKQDTCDFQQGWKDLYRFALKLQPSELNDLLVNYEEVSR